MRYVKAETILPDNLVKEIQMYIQGEYVYIPSGSKSKKKWGEKSGTREHIRLRNEEIFEKYKRGYAIIDLAEEFYLSVESIIKIVYTKNKYEELPL